MSIRKIFDEIGNEPSTNKKMVILGKYKDDELLKKVLYLANTRRIKFYIKQIPSYSVPLEPTLTLFEAVDQLSFLYERKYTGGEAIEHLRKILSSLNKDDSYIIECIIGKDCKIGIGSNINKVIPKLIETTPYMGAIPYKIDKVKKLFSRGYVFGQVKMDGRYCNAIIRDGEVELESRQGEVNILTGAKFLEELSLFSDCVLNGELTLGSGISRYEANGIISSLIDILSKKDKRTEKETKAKISKFESKHMPFNEALNLIQYTVWDTIKIDEYYDNKSITPYYARLTNLHCMIDSVRPTKVKDVETIKCNTFEELLTYFQTCLNLGEEGIICKTNDGEWVNGKPTHQCKMKLDITIDLKIVGFNYGNGKNSDVISSLNCETSDGIIKTRPTGIEEDEMRYITDNQHSLLGTIIECKSCGISVDANGNYSLLHPVYICRRDDLIKANSFEEAKEIEDMAKGLTKNK